MNKIALISLFMLMGCGGESTPSGVIEVVQSSSRGCSTDAGHPMDSGTVVPDSGVRIVDSGTPVVDSGTPVVDSGTPVPDAGSPRSDGGTKPQSLVWIWVNYVNNLNVVAAHLGSFTQVSPAFYDINYAYSGAMPNWYQGVDSWGGLTSQQYCQSVHNLGLQCIPLVFGGSGNGGTDQGIQNILDDNPAGTQAGFINSMMSEAIAKDYDGINLDWEVGGAGNDYSTYGVKLINFLRTFKADLNAQGKTLSLDLGTWYIKQTWCSGGSGLVDLTQLGAVVDYAILENYDSTLGTASSSCPSSLSNPQTCTLHFTDDLNLMCVYMPSSVVMIGLESDSNGTNPIAGAVFTELNQYGIQNVATWPNTFTMMSEIGVQPSTFNWFTALQGFLQTAP